MMASKTGDKLTVIKTDNKNGRNQLSLEKNINEVTLDEYQDIMFTL